MSNSKLRIALLVGEGLSSNVIYHALKDEFDIITVIVESRIPRLDLVKRRIKRLGWRRVAGQLAFQVFVSPLLDHSSLKHRNEILAENGLSISPIPQDIRRDVATANSQETIGILQEITPDAVVINGTRILSADVLDSVPAPFLNTHAGITPLFRGVHGGYWALVQRMPEACGVTVHLVDTGIDTGSILAQAHIVPTSRDNFATYPWLQLAVGVNLLKQCLRTHSDGQRQYLSPPVGASGLWYHPTLWEYLANRLIKGVR